MTDLKALIRTIPDYPTPGVQFRDITTLLADAAGFAVAITDLAAPYLDPTTTSAPIDAVAGIEARGFIVGGAVADRLGCGFIPVRKRGKLPGPTLAQSYALEYGADEVEIHEDAVAPGNRILIVDDLIATGGTAQAAAILLRRAGADVVGAAFVIDLPDLGGGDLLRRLGLGVHTLVSFEGD